MTPPGEARRLPKSAPRRLSTRSPRFVYSTFRDSVGNCCGRQTAKIATEYLIGAPLGAPGAGRRESSSGAFLVFGEILALGGAVRNALKLLYLK